MNTSLSVHDCFSFGWRSFKARPWFFVLVTAIVIIVSGVSGSIQGNLTEQLGKLVGGGISGILALVIDTFMGMGLLALYLKAHGSVTAPRVADLWHPHPFFRFLFAYLILSLVLLVGYLFLIIPGVILTLALCFTTTIVIDRGLEPVAAMQESARITKGKRIKILLLILAVVAVNVLGALALIVGLLVSIPVSMLAVIHAYRTLSTQASLPTTVS